MVGILLKVLQTALANDFYEVARVFRGVKRLEPLPPASLREFFFFPLLPPLAYGAVNKL